MDMDTGDIIRMPLMDELLSFKPQDLSRYFQNAQALLGEEVQTDNYDKLETFMASRLKGCERLYHKGYRRMAAFTAREHHSDIATCMMVSGATEIEVRDMPFIEHLDRDLGYNRVICDLVDLEKYAWPYVMDSVYASKRESVCVFALSERCMKDAEYNEWRDDVARSYTVDQIVKWEKCYLVKIVRKRNSGSKRTIFRDLARCKLSTAIEGVKDRSTKGSRLIRDGDWV